MQKFQLSIALIVTFILSGCGGGPKGLNTCYVEGVVTLDGQPLDRAMVTFIPKSQGQDSKTAVGHTDSAGKYMLTSDGGLPQKGALAGDYVVTISKVEVKTQEEDRSSSSNSANRSSNSGRPQYSTQTLLTPKAYSVAATTPLTATVVKGKNDLPFEITSGK